MKLAIQGHVTRGNEVIQILESLGGINRMNQSGCYTNYYYYISGDDNTIAWTCVRPQHLGVFTLEEFEKEFPFKVGDRVISTTTGCIGTITKCNKNGCCYVKYDNGNTACAFGQYLKLYQGMERNVTLTLEKAKEWYKKGGELREIALQAFTEMELTSLPKSWKDYCKNYPIKPEEIFIDGYSKFVVNNVGDRNPVHDKNICPSRESAEAHLAMIQLEQLRDCWLAGWKPKWDVSQKWCIRLYKNQLHVGLCTDISRFLTFPTREMAEEFLKCFWDLIEAAKALI